LPIIIIYNQMPCLKINLKRGILTYAAAKAAEGKYHKIPAKIKLTEYNKCDNIKKSLNARG